jgi:hypothetical protein
MEWPECGEWDLEISSHVEKRMEDRNFTEIDLRTMLERASRYVPDVVEGRWLISTRHQGHPWEVIVEPDPDRMLLVVITAYPVER